MFGWVMGCRKRNSNGKKNPVSLLKDEADRRCHTWRGIWIVGGECHCGFEVAAVVHRVRVHHYQGNIPVEDVVIVQLDKVCQQPAGVGVEKTIVKW